MAVKKKAELGPKAKLMKKNVDQLKRQAKKLKIESYSTKKKEQLVNSIMMAEARAKRKPGTKRKKAAPKASAVKSVSTRVTMKGSGMKRRPKRIARNATRRPNKPMMAEYNGWSNYETWLTNLHFDQAFYEIAQEHYANIEGDMYDLANQFSAYVNDVTFELIQGDNSYFVDDMANAFLAQVNYQELAEMASEDFQ
jgi:hypothetical protein